MSKAGIQRLFGSKQALQIAVIDRARELFVEAVIERLELLHAASRA